MAYRTKKRASAGVMWLVAFVTVLVFIITLLGREGDLLGAFGAAAGVAGLVWGLMSHRVAWILYVAAMASSGISIQVLGQTVLPEHVLLIVLICHALFAPRAAEDLKGSARAYKQEARLRLALVLLVAWLVLLSVMSAFNASVPEQSLRLIMWLAINVVAAVVVYKSRQDLFRMIRDALSTMIVLIVIAITGWAFASATSTLNIFVEKDYASETFRMKGLMLEPNLLAAICLLWLCLAYIFHKAITRRLFWCAVIFMSVAIFLTYTRTAWVMLAVLVVAAVIKASSHVSRLFVIPVVLLITLIAFESASNVGLPQGENSITGTVSDRAEDMFNFATGTGAFRLITWEIAAEEIARDGILFGHGYNAFPQSHENFITGSGQLYLGFFWLALLYDAGLLGFLSFLFAFILIWRSGAKGSYILFLSFIALSISTNPTWYAFPWVLAILAVRADAMDRGTLGRARFLPDDLKFLRRDAARDIARLRFNNNKYKHSLVVSEQ